MDPMANQEFAAVRWIWITGADLGHTPDKMAAEFHYKLHLDSEPARASMHVIARAAFVARVNGKITGEHSGWNSFDREEIRGSLRFGRGAAGDNDIAIAVTGPDDVHHVEVIQPDETIQVSVDEVQPGGRAPMSQKARFDVLLREGALEKRVFL